MQELSGITPTANLLTGALDEYFTRTDSSGARDLLTDGLGSAAALADTTGAVPTQYTFEPFGNTSQSGTSTTNSFAYIGREADGTGLLFYRARYYNPAFARFVSEDPAGLAFGSNLYQYTYESPTNFLDPSGLWTVQVGGTVGGNLPVWGPGGVAGSVSAGIAYDGSHWAFYWGGGLGVGVGAGVSGGVTVGGSNASSVCGLRGLFADVSGPHLLRESKLHVSFCGVRLERHG